jgi:hypothetical protein
MEIEFREKLLLLDSIRVRTLKIDELLSIFSDEDSISNYYKDERNCIVDLCTRLTGYNVDEFYNLKH